MLAGLIWWISWLLDTQRIERAADDDEVESAAIASATTSPRVATTGSDAVPVSLADLLPLGPEDEGFRVIVRGTVVGEPLDEGFWFLTDEDEVLFARRSVQAESGQDLTLTGTLHQVAAAEGAAWAERSRLRGAAGWKVHHDLYLEVDSPRSAAAAATQVDSGAVRDST